MSLPANIHFANAPISWGVNEFDSSNRVPPTKMLHELQQAGYTGTEMGDLGYFVGKDNSLSRELKDEKTTFGHQLETRGLSCIGAFVTYSLWNPEKHEEGRTYARKVAKEFMEHVVKRNVNKKEGCSFDQRPHLVLADNVVDKERIRCTSQITPKQSLSAEKWATLVKEVKDLKKIIRDEFGLECYFHPHCGSFVETPWEIEALIRDVPDLKLIFDTAHITMGASSKPLYLANFLNRYGKEKVHSFHFKDYTPDVQGKDYFELVKNGCFPELGQGICDFAGVRDWQLKNDYKGWIVVEQDIIDNVGSDSKSKVQPTTNKPLVSAINNMNYLKELFSQKPSKM